MSAALKTGADARAMRTTKFPAEFSKKVDMTKVHLPVIKKWVSDEVSRILNSDDEVVIEMINGILEGNKNPNIKQLQTDISGFLDKDAPSFCLALWKLCLSAQESPSGIPKELLEAKKNELAQEKAAEDRAREEALRREEEARQRDREMARVRDRERGQRRGGGRGSWRGRDRSYDRRPPSRDSRSRSRSRSRSPPPRRRDRGTDSYVPRGGRRDDYAPRRRRSPSYGRSRSPSRSRTPPRRRRRNTSSEPSSSPPRRRRRSPDGDLISRADRGKERLSREPSSHSEEVGKGD